MRSFGKCVLFDMIVVLLVSHRCTGCMKLSLHGKLTCWQECDNWLMDDSKNSIVLSMFLIMLRSVGVPGRRLRCSGAEPLSITSPNKGRKFFYSGCASSSIDMEGSAEEDNSEQLFGQLDEDPEQLDEDPEQLDEDPEQFRGTYDMNYTDKIRMEEEEEDQDLSHSLAEFTLK